MGEGLLVFEPREDTNSMSFPVLVEPECQWNPFKPSATVSLIDLRRLKSAWTAAVTWCEESRFESNELLGWLKRECEIAHTFVDFMLGVQTGETIEAAIAGAPSTRWGTGGYRDAELRYWKNPQTVLPRPAGPFVLRPIP
jgi:hypothetical protein